MLAMRRFGWITYKHLAQAGRIGERAGENMVVALRDAGFLRVLKTGASIGLGKRPNLVSLSDAGNTVLESCEPDLLADWPGFVLAKRDVKWGATTQHKLDLITAMIAAERHLPAGMFCDIRVEFRGDPLFAHYATTSRLPNGDPLRFDGVLTLGQGGETAAYGIELERTAKPVIATKASTEARSFEAKLLRNWLYIRSGNVADRYAVTSPLLTLLVIAESDAMIERMINRVRWEAFQPIEIGGGDALGPADLIYFTTLVQAQADFYGPIWRVHDAAAPLSFLGQQS